MVKVNRKREEKRKKDQKEEKTTGEIAQKLSLADDCSYTLQDQIDQHKKSVVVNVEKAVKDGLRSFDSNFYIAKHTRRNAYIVNSIQNHYLIRQTCPMPEYSQSVWKYTRKDDVLEELWVLPEETEAIEMMHNSKYINKDEFALMEYVIKFKNGELKQLALKEGAENDR